MTRTHWRKIWGDISARRGRTLLVVVSILIGVFGVTTMTSTADVVTRQLNEDIKPEGIAHFHVYVTTPPGEVISSEQNQGYLETLRGLPGVVDAEGQAIYPVTWRKAGDTGAYENSFIVSFTEPFGEANLEAVSRVTAGRYPEPGEIAVEQRFAEANNLELGDRLVFPQSGESWEIVGFVLHPYFVIVPAIQDQLQAYDAIYANYEDAQLLAGSSGLSAFHIRYTDKAAFEAGQDNALETIATQTDYTVLFTFIDDPENSFLLELMGQVTGILAALGIVAAVVSGFLVTNVMNTILLEQRRQIGAMKAIGAGAGDVFRIYAGMALVYGLIGTVIGVMIAVPVASAMSLLVAENAFTYLQGFQFSPLGIGLGVGLGLLVPVLAALIPVVNGMRVTILDAIVDLGLGSNWGQSPFTRGLGRLPLPMPVQQALRNVYQKKWRLLLNGLTLMLAAASFMGVTAVTGSLSDFILSVSNASYAIVITPQSSEELATLESLLVGQVEGVEAVYPGHRASIGIEGYESSDPLAAGTNQIRALGIDPHSNTFEFDLLEGEGWQDGSQQGVIISRSMAENLDKGVGDTVSFQVGGQEYSYEVLAIDAYGFDAVFMDWQALARMSGYVDEAGQPIPSTFYVALAGDPSVSEVDDTIEAISTHLNEYGVAASYVNQVLVDELQIQPISLFGVIFSLTSGIMAAVGAIGLMAALSMAVFERQKEIGVMRSVGAGSGAIAGQFLLEGLLVGMLAWVVAAPVSVWFGREMNAALPFPYLTFTYPLYVLALGLVGMLAVAALASLLPSWAASRKTISDILRYQ